MNHRLYIIEGLPCSGKSTTSAFVAELLKAHGKVCYVDEGTGEHPADYEFHALAPAGWIVSSTIMCMEHMGRVLVRKALKATSNA